MMSFLVQDFLDYAQIKSGKFRMNIHPFNIIDTLEKVKCILFQKANDTGIELKVEPVNFNSSAQENSHWIRKSNLRFNPIVYTDEQRVM